MTSTLPKRLIEVDLPIKRISEQARREKSIRHGHISTLHIWWARRPLAACRAVLCASLWPDPADPYCPEVFRKAARKQMLSWAGDNLKLLGSESIDRFVAIRNKPSQLENNEILRYALLDFIAEFADWDNSTKKEFLETSRALTESANMALGNALGTRPLVYDPFAGGGSIPFEALRIGADVFASDLNPIPVLLNKVALEYLPTYGQRLRDEVRKWGDQVLKEADDVLSEFYPKDPDGAIPIAYLWARVIACEGPGCGAEVPLIRSLEVARKVGHSVALQLVPRTGTKQVEMHLITKEGSGWVRVDDHSKKVANPNLEGTVKRGSATCPYCGYTTPVTHVRLQLTARAGGAADARLLCVVTKYPSKPGRIYRLPSELDFAAVRKAIEYLSKLSSENSGQLSFIPNESVPITETASNQCPFVWHEQLG